MSPYIKNQNHEHATNAIHRGNDWYCDECNAYLNEQNGFTTDHGEWTCESCGHLNIVTLDKVVYENTEEFYGSNVDMKEYVEAENDDSGKDDRVAGREYGEEDKSEPHVHHWYCDECNAYLNEQDGFNVESGEWVCTACGHANDVSHLKIDDDFDLRASNFNPEVDIQEYLMDESYVCHAEGTNCGNCHEDLHGGYKAERWEEGSNPDSFVICPHCGYKNIMDDDD